MTPIFAALDVVLRSKVASSRPEASSGEMGVLGLLPRVCSANLSRSVDRLSLGRLEKV